MATTIRKCVSLAPSEPGPNGSPGNEQDLRNCIDVVRDSGSRWIKLWARWDRVQQQQIPWYQLGDPSVNTLGYKYVAALDAQIDLARSQNPAIGVLLQSYCFPQWLNGTSHLTTRAQDIEFYPQDRMSKATYQAGDPGDSRRPLIFRVPPMEQLGVEGAWGVGCVSSTSDTSTMAPALYSTFATSPICNGGLSRPRVRRAIASLQIAPPSTAL